MKTKAYLVSMRQNVEVLLVEKLIANSSSSYKYMRNLLSRIFDKRFDKIFLYIFFIYIRCNLLAKRKGLKSLRLKILGPKGSIFIP